MKSRLIVLYLIFISCTLTGQQNLFPDLLARNISASTAVVERDCVGCEPARNDGIISKYYFDDNGMNSIRYSISDSEPSGKQVYNYEGNILTSYENYSTWIFQSVDDDGDYIMIWDSTFLTNTVTYEYVGGKIRTVKWFDDPDNILVIQVNYIYNNDGKIDSKEIEWYPESGITGQFRPNSDSLVRVESFNGKRINIKKYEYSENTVTIKYFKEGLPTGIETITTEESGSIVKAVLKSSNLETLSTSIKQFDSQGRLINENLAETGYDGFGNSFDSFGYGRTTYEYDSEGQLSIKRSYSDDQLMIEERYSYQ